MAALVVIVLALPAAASSTATAARAANQAQAATTYTLRMYTGEPSDNLASVALRRFASLLNKQTHGHLKVDLYYSGSLGGNSAALTDALHNTIQGYTEDAQTLQTTFPAAAFTDLPYLFAGVKQAEEYWNSPIAQQERAAILQKTGLRVLNAMQGGFHCVWSKSGPVTTVAGYKGVKFATPDNPTFLAMYQALGANTVLSTSLSDEFTLLNEGVAQAADMGLSTGMSASFQQASKYFSFTNDDDATNMIMINNDFWNTLPKAYQADLAKDAKLVQRSENKAFAALRAKDIGLVQKDGITVSYMTAAEHALQRQTVQGPIYSKLGSKMGPLAVKWLQEWTAYQKTHSA